MRPMLCSPIAHIYMSAIQNICLSSVATYGQTKIYGQTFESTAKNKRLKPARDQEIVEELTMCAAVTREQSMM